MKPHSTHPDLEPGPPGPLPLVDPGADVPAVVRDALEAGRAELPSAAVLARLAAKLPPPGPPGGSGTPLREGGSRLRGARGRLRRAGRRACQCRPAAPSVLPGVVIGALLGVAVSGVLALWTPPPSVEGASGSAAVVATGAADGDRRPGVERPSAGDTGASKRSEEQ